MSKKATVVKMEPRTKKTPMILKSRGKVKEAPPQDLSRVVTEFKLDEMRRTCNRFKADSDGPFFHRDGQPQLLWLSHAKIRPDARVVRVTVEVVQ
jgi:hypothetical protein